MTDLELVGAHGLLERCREMLLAAVWVDGSQVRQRDVLVAELDAFTGRPVAPAAKPVDRSSFTCRSPGCSLLPGHGGRECNVPPAPPASSPTENEPAPAGPAAYFPSAPAGVRDWHPFPRLRAAFAAGRSAR